MTGIKISHESVRSWALEWSRKRADEVAA